MVFDLPLVSGCGILLLYVRWHVACCGLLSRHLSRLLVALRVPVLRHLTVRVRLPVRRLRGCKLNTQTKSEPFLKYYSEIILDTTL